MKTIETMHRTKTTLVAMVIGAAAGAVLTSCHRAATPATDHASAMNDATTNAVSSSATHSPTPSTPPRTTSGLNFTMNRIDGTAVNLAEKYAGNVVLIVNVASKCGLTPQYAGLQQLHEKYSERGLAVLGFPANEFGNQEPGTNEEIATFCEDNFGVTFDMFSKIVVKGDGISPLYAHLTAEETNADFAGEIRWNFEKFLIGRDGRVIARFDPRVSPSSDEMIAAIESALGMH